MKKILLALLLLPTLVLAQTPPANVTNNVVSGKNVTPFDCSGTVTVGGTAQNAIAANSNLRGFMIMNLDNTEPLWISFTGTANVNGTSSYPLTAGTASTYSGAGSYSAQLGFGSNNALSVNALTSTHKYSCTYW